ncbi:MAG: accessory factor UbiK family protein [Thiotrichaceae bacterium]
MDSSNPVEQLAKRLSTLLPGSVDDIRKDFEGNLRSGIESGLRSMNLVTREEFEVQSAVLQKTREKLEKLEKLVGELEVSANITD